MKTLFFLFAIVCVYSSATVQATVLCATAAHSNKVNGLSLMSVSDLDFGDVVPGSSTVGYITVKNIGIRPFTVSSLDSLSTDSDIFFLEKKVFPIELGGEGEFQIQVRFIPKERKLYKVELRVRSNADSWSKSTGTIRGAVIDYLYAPTVDFGSRRVGKGPYNTDKNGQPAMLKFINYSSQPITINSATIGAGNPTAFELSLSSLAGRTIQPDDSVSLPVHYLPIITCVNDSVNILVNTDGVTPPTKTHIIGKGIAPHISVSNPVFYAQGASGTFLSQKITIRNLNEPEWECPDVVMIEDIFHGTNKKAISKDSSVAGTKGFAYSKSTIPFPIILQPGEEYSFTAYFLPFAAGRYEDTLRIFSDATSNGISIWKAFVSKVTTVPTESTLPYACSLTPHPVSSDETLLSFYNAESGIVRIDILSTQGETVTQIAHSYYDAGEQSLRIATTTLANGVYLLRVQTPSGSLHRSFVVMR